MVEGTIYITVRYTYCLCKSCLRVPIVQASRDITIFMLVVAPTSCSIHYVVSCHVVDKCCRSGVSLIILVFFGTN